MDMLIGLPDDCRSPSDVGWQVVILK